MDEFVFIDFYTEEKLFVNTYNKILIDFINKK